MAEYDPIEIAWCAGFADGEAFMGQSSGPLVTISQVDRWPLDRWMKTFSFGSLVLRPAQKENANDFWRWSASGANAIVCMLTLREQLSPRRQKSIDTTVFLWAAKQQAREERRDLRCPHGHVGFKRKREGRGVICTECVRLKNAANYERRRAVRLNQE